MDQEFKNAVDNKKNVDALKWVKFPVLNDGFVCLVDCMGSDHDIANAARVSYGDGTKKTSDDAHLLNYLMRHRHTSPFEMAEIKFMVRVPMDCWRQWVRHRTASINEYSTRYSIAIDSIYSTDPTEWRKQAASNKQGSDGLLDKETGERLSSIEKSYHEVSKAIYQHRIANGVAREQARKDLPLCTYTEAYWKIDLHNLFHFLGLRMESHAQEEIRQYATTIFQSIVKPLFPLSSQAFENYCFNSMTLSQWEQDMIKNLFELCYSPVNVDDDINFDKATEYVPKGREFNEFKDKLQRLGIIKEGKDQ